MLHKRRSFGSRKVSPPQPTCMTDEQKTSYLTSLRANRLARPSGSRPLPSKPSISNLRNDQTSLPLSEPVLSLSTGETKSEEPTKTNSPSLPPSLPTISNQKGRPLARAPTENIGNRRVTPPEVLYRESSTRQREKQEAHSLRRALEKIDHEDDETRIYTSAQMEAADLVWKHMNPQLAEHEKVAAYRNPDIAKKRYIIQHDGSALDKRRTSGQSRLSSVADRMSEDERMKFSETSRDKSPDTATASTSADTLTRSKRRSSGNRQFSNGSTKGVFRNPEDQIYEEPEEVEIGSREEMTRELPLRSRTRNSLPRGSRPLPEKPHSVPGSDTSKVNRYEIWKNPPSQSRKADYAINETALRSQTPEQIETPKGRALEIRSEEIRAATSMKKKDRSPKLPTPTAVSDRLGRPIVSFDPSWRPGNDSPRASVDVERPAPRPMPSLPAMTLSAPAIPTIKLSDDNDGSIPSINLPIDEPTVPSISIYDSPSIPTISIPDEEPETDIPDIPTISVSDDTPQSRPLPTIIGQSNPRPLPKIGGQMDPTHKSRPLPSHTQSSPPKLPPDGPSRGAASRLPWLSRSPTASTISGGRTTTVTCTACDLPISGRIVTASGSATSTIKARFHPECFTCFHCSTALECVSFYPEPESALLSRLGLTIESETALEPKTNNYLASDLRFYCHLDYHELFSPKCASCHTPIEGAVILAAGKAWHEGHFFCAECGDPFSSSSPFVENKGYAYCVSCHTRRTSARCKSCKNQILDEISVEALGGKWHESCFCCDECNGGFGEEGRFFVREVEVELTEKERRRGMERKLEERAVCEACEGRRLKGVRLNAFI